MEGFESTLCTTTATVCGVQVTTTKCFYIISDQDFRCTGPPTSVFLGYDTLNHSTGSPAVVLIQDFTTVHVVVYYEVYYLVYIYYSWYYCYRIVRQCHRSILLHAIFLVRVIYI